MKLTDFENADSSIVNLSFDIQIKNFRHRNSEPEEIDEKFTHTYCKELFEIDIYILVFYEESNDSMIVELDPHVESRKFKANHYNAMKCSLSVIDIEGNSRSPQYFYLLHTDKNFGNMVYLRKSYILENAEEFLPNDVLTIRCDVCFDFSEVEFTPGETESEANLWRFLNKIPQTYCNNSGFDAVFDFTLLVLTLPQFHESRKRFGVYGIPPTSLSPNFDSKVNIQEYMDQVWIFDTDNARFLLNSEMKPRRLWDELLEDSPVIRKHVNDILTEKKEKVISLPNIKARTFLFALIYLEHIEFIFYKLDDYFNIEKMSRSYEMEKMRKVCNGAIDYYNDRWKPAEEEPKVFDLSSYKYLSNVWDSRRHDFELLMQFLISIPQIRCSRNKAQIEIPNDDLAKGDLCESFTVYDFSSEVLILPQFHESRKRFGVFGIPPSSSSPCPDANENNLELVWIIDTCPDRFILSLDESHDSIGSRLLKMSSVVRLCTITNGKEQNEKRIDFSHLSSWIFLNVLYFAENGVLRCSDFHDFLDIYKMAHLYEMKELQNICAEEMVKSVLYQTEFDEIESVIDLYQDKNLKTLFDSRRRDYNLPDISSSPTIYISDNKVASQIDCRNCVSSTGLNKNFTVYDFTPQDLNEKKETFDFKDISPKEQILDEVFIFDTCSDRFIFSMRYNISELSDPELFASKLSQLIYNFRKYFDSRIFQMIVQPSVLIPNTSSRTFRNFLYYLKMKSLSSFDFRDLSDLYKMTFFYRLSSIRRECAMEMEKRCKSPSDFETIMKRFSDINLGKDFRMMFESPRDFTENAYILQPTTKDRSYFECYI